MAEVEEKRHKTGKKGKVALLVGPQRTDDVDSIDPSIRQKLQPHVELVDYETAKACSETDPVDAIATFAHVNVDSKLVQTISPRGSLKAVVNYGVGVDHISLDEMRDLGVPVSNTPGVLSGATADMAWALLMACARNTVQCDAYCRSDNYTVYRNMVFLGRDVHHKTIGIVGLGRIGSEIAHRAKGFHMRILYHNRSSNKEAEETLGATLVSLDELLSQSDYVVIACPSTPETARLISAPQLKQMKNTAFLVNIARGAIVDTNALVSALRSKQIAGAGLDVTDPEPIPLGHPLRSLDNVVLAPHRGSATAEARAAMAQLVVDNLLAAVEGKPLVTRCT